MDGDKELILKKDELDLVALWGIIWRGKIIIATVITIFSVLSVAYALYLPNIYRADVVLYPVSLKTQSDVSGAAGGLRGIASLAGINVGSGEGSKTDFALEVLKSRKFITEFIDKHGVLVPLIAIKSWNKENDSEMYDETLYDVNSEKWRIDPETKLSLKPTELHAYNNFVEKMIVEKDPETGIVKVAFEFISPVRAKEWLDRLIVDLNNVIRDKDVLLADDSISYLESQIEKTNLSGVKNIFFSLIEDQIQKKLLAETRSEYIFEVIDPPVVEERNVRPKRALICIIGALLGGILGMLVVFIRSLRQM